MFTIISVSVMAAKDSKVVTQATVNSNDAFKNLAQKPAITHECFILCLIAESNLKMIKFSNSFKLHEIVTDDSPFDEDLKI